MAKKKKRRRNNSFTLPVAVVAPVFASFVSNMGEGTINSGGVLQDLRAGRLDYASRDLLLLYTGFDTAGGGWNPMRAKALQGIFLGALIHKAAGKLGINRALGRAGVPFIRI